MLMIEWLLKAMLSTKVTNNVEANSKVGPGLRSRTQTYGAASIFVFKDNLWIMLI